MASQIVEIQDDQSGTSHFHHDSHTHRTGKRLRNLLVLPSGRRIHVAPSPEEAVRLRKRLDESEKDQSFDLVLNGSPEHLEAMRTVHTHHEGRRAALREKHGTDFDEFEAVRRDLDTLSHELHQLTNHAVSLDANFDKYGFSAHLRTYDSPTPDESAANSIYGHDHQHEKKDWEAERRNGRVMKVYKTPIVRQYFHKGLLWRASGTTQVASFELFVDLLFVGILAINGDHVGEEPNGEEVHRFVITFIMSWKLWSDLAVVISRFETDDLVQRIAVLINIIALLGLTVNMLDAFHHSYTMLVAFYVAARIFLAAYYFMLVFTVPMIRGSMLAQCVLALVPVTFWIASIYVEMPNRFILIWIAIAIDLVGPISLPLVTRVSKLLPKRLGDMVDKAFEFTPAMSIEHRVERTNAFVALVFGYSVVAIMYQNAADYGLNAFFGKATLGLIQAFCFNWIYFELDGEDLYQHAIRRNVYSAMLWASAHLPLIMGYVLAAGALSKMVVATDIAGLDSHDLTHFYENKSEDHLSDGLRWFYCVGLAFALASMGLVSISHIHRDTTEIRIRKRYRLLNRWGVCIVMCVLPTAHNLNSLHLISITTGMVVYVLLIELWGTTVAGDSLFAAGTGKQKCSYVAKCKISSKDLEAAAKGGHVIKVEDYKDSGEKGAYH